MSETKWIVSPVPLREDIETLATENNVSHSMRHTKRTFDANIQKVDVEINGKKGKKNICAKCLKTMKKEAK